MELVAGFQFKYLNSKDLKINAKNKREFTIKFSKRGSTIRWFQNIRRTNLSRSREFERVKRMPIGRTKMMPKWWI